MGVGVSRDDRWIMIGIGSKTSSEIRLLDAADPSGEFRVVAARREGVEYDVEPAGDRLLIVHNADNPDSDLAWAPLTCSSHEEWKPLLGSAPGERFQGVDAFAGFAVLSLRKDGLTALRVLPRDDSAESGYGTGHDLSFSEPVYQVGLGENPETDTGTIQIVFESMVTPKTVSDYAVDARELTLLKRQPVLGGYDPSAFEQRRSGRSPPMAPGSRSPWSSPPVRSRTAPGPVCSRHTARMRPPPTRTSPWRGSRCCSGGSSTRSRTCAAGARWAARGTTTGSSCPRRTRSPTSSTALHTLSTRDGWPRIGLRQRVARPVVSSSAPL